MQVNIWLSNNIIRCQVSILVDFGEFFYMVEMKWDQETSFRCGNMASRWQLRIDLLEAALADPKGTFLTTAKRLAQLECSIEEQDRIWADVNQFVSSLLNYYRPVKKRWITFPYILFALGDTDRTISSRVAKQIVLSRERKPRTDLEGVCSEIKDLHLVKHELFQPPLYDALQAFSSRPLSATACRPLKIWLEQNVFCVSHQNLTVESSFNHMTRIIQDGGGSRGLYAQEGAQAHLQNICLPDHAGHTSKKFKYTEDSRNQILKGINQHVNSMRLITPVPRLRLEPAYVEAFTKRKVRARPQQRKQYNTQIEANKLRIKAPYQDSSDNEGSDDHLLQSGDELSTSTEEDESSEEEKVENKNQATGAKVKEAAAAPAAFAQSGRSAVSLGKPPHGAGQEENKKQQTSVLAKAVPTAASAKPASSANVAPASTARGKPSLLLERQPSPQCSSADDDGRRQDTHLQRRSDAVSAEMCNGSLCYICLSETCQHDFVCDVRSCSLSFHQACFKTMWSCDASGPLEQCPCTWCPVCKTKPKENTKKYGKPVGRCERCSTNVHLECARANDFYCPVCFVAIWPK